MMRRIVAAMCWIALGGAASGAAPGLSNQPGTWQFRADYSRGYPFGATPAETRAVAAQVAALAEIVRQTAVFNPPLGFQARPYARYSPFNCELSRNCTAGPLVSELDVVFCYFAGLSRQGNPAWGGELKSHAVFYINDMPHTIPGDCFRSASPLRMPGRRKICLEPVESRRVAGFPVFSQQGVETLVLTNGRPAWVPMSAEEYLQAMIGDRLAGLDDPLRAELAALTPEQRGLQAWHLPSHNAASGLVPPGTSHARPVVTENPNYFDRSLPRTAIQLLSVDLVYYMLVAEPAESDVLGNRRVWEFSNMADWKRIAAVVEPAAR
jgi:hypothetical protein